MPGSHPNDMRVDIHLALLWDDPKFNALLNDPTNNAPLAFTVPAYAIEKQLETLRRRNAEAEVRAAFG